MSGKVISGPAAVLLIAFFFFPWILVSCEGTPLGEFSGYQLAAGVPPDSLSGLVSPDNFESEPVLFAVPLAGLVALLLLGVTLWKANFEQNAAWGQIIVSFAALLILLLEWQMWRQNSDPSLNITVRPALWGSLVSLLALAGGAVWDIVAWYRARPSPQAQPAVPSAKQSFRPQPSPTPGGQAHNLAGSFGSSQATLVEDDLPGIPGASQATIVEDDGISPAPAQATIVEDNAYEAGRGQATIVADDLLSDGSSGIKTEVLHFEPEPLAWLIMESGDDVGRKFTLFGDDAIGRVAENDIVIDDTAMSSYHARVKEENGRFTIIDMNSTNGVYISRAGQKRWEKQTHYELHHGDRIKLGRVILQFNVQE